MSLLSSRDSSVHIVTTRYAGRSEVSFPAGTGAVLLRTSRPALRLVVLLVSGYRGKVGRGVNTYMHTYIHTYRVIQEESARLREMIVCVILSKKFHMNMGPILNGYRVKTA